MKSLSTKSSDSCHKKLVKIHVTNTDLSPEARCFYIFGFHFCLMKGPYTNRQSEWDPFSSCHKSILKQGVLITSERG